uniref:Poly [ADP-ribose] polymerase n=1 Tax=Esox lucius TaxID=8010 RepID=A0A6Q2WYE7_ESOLU
RLREIVLCFFHLRIINCFHLLTNLLGDVLLLLLFHFPFSASPPLSLSAGMPADLMCSTRPGQLACKEIIHVAFEHNTKRIRKVCKNILKLCERKGYQSATFPAVNTGSLLWYLCLQRFQAKNGVDQVGEKILYHGTKATTCDAIEKNGFDRSYASSRVTRYGVGVYFAVNASYSANPRYTPPDGVGHRRMYVARVLTGYYTVGNETMRHTPKRSSTENYDSLVDNQQTPSMFVTFHDDQAYPEYLITFT